MSRIPLIDLTWQHRQVAAAVAEGWQRVIERSAFVGGPEVAEFERAFAGFSGVAHCVGVGNGTDALELVLRALGAGPGDEVIVPAMTFAASALAVVRAGATPVLVDVDADTLLIDPGAVKAAAGPRTRAVVPVHLYGQMADMEALGAFAADAGIAVVEDAAQAHGAAQHGRTAGSIGLAAGVSFYPAKNLGAYGDAGAVLTSDDALAARVRALGNYGSESKYEHPEPGFNSRLDTLQAVVLSANLERLGEWNEGRRAAAERYDELLGGIDGVAFPVTARGNRHVWHLYVVRVAERDRILSELHARGIGAGVHYPRPIHLHGAFAPLGYRAGEFPNAEAAAREVLSLPMWPGITLEQQERVAEALRSAL